MIKKATLFALFIVSYIPLFLILAIQNLDEKCPELLKRKSYNLFFKQNTVSIILVTIILVAVLYYIIFAKINSKYGFGTPEKVVGIKNTGIEYLSYLATYILPFVGLKFDAWNSISASTILFLLIGFIYTKTNLLYANPTLALFNYNIYEVEIEGNPNRIIITKGTIKMNQYYRFKQINDNIFYSKS